MNDMGVSAKRIFGKTGALLPLFVLLAIYFSLMSDNFLTSHNLSTIAMQSVYFTIIVIAQAIVMITGGFDLSVGSSIAITSIITALVLVTVPGDSAIVLACGAGILAGAAVGVANGAVAAIFRVSPLIVTLATALIVSGLALIITGGVPIFSLPESFRATLYAGTVFGIPVPWIALILVIVLMYGVIYWHRIGRTWYAIGGNWEASRNAGIRVRLSLFLAYVAGGALVGVAGVLLTARVGSGTPNLGATFPLESIAAAVLGGVSLGGGRGSLWGAVLGAIFLVMLKNGLTLTDVSSYMQMVITGGLLIFAVVVDHYWHS